MSCRIMQVTQNLRQFSFGLGRDFFPGDLLFAPNEEDLLEGRETVRVTTEPHNGEVKEVPRSCVVPTEFVVEERRLLRPMQSARTKVGADHGR